MNVQWMKKNKAKMYLKKEDWPSHDIIERWAHRMFRNSRIRYENCWDKGVQGSGLSSFLGVVKNRADDLQF